MESIEKQPMGILVGSAAGKPKQRVLWVDYNYFCRLSTISDYNKRQLKARRRFQFNRNGDINLLSVNNQDRAKYGISPDNEMIITKIEILKNQDAAVRLERENESFDVEMVDRVHDQMFIALNEFPVYRNRINEAYNLPSERCTLFARRWAVWAWVLPNYGHFKYCLEIYHNAYSRIFPEHFAGENGKISFKNFFNSCEANGIENTIIDKRAVVKTQKRRPAFQMAFLETLYVQDRKIIVADAYRKLVKACAEKDEKPMSEANVKIVFREFKNNAELFGKRYGEGALQKQMPYLSLLPAEHRNTQWQIDGWTLPFWGDKFQRYTLYIIRDNHSRKIVAANVAVSENSTLIAETLEDAVRNTGVFCGELVADKHSFHRTEIAARLRLETEKMGVVWTVTMNAQRNQLAERYNQYLDAICKDFDGYLGKNITATGKDARPSPETLTETAKPRNWKEVDEIKAIAAYAVIEFNRTPLKPLSGLSPNEKYDASESKRAFMMDEAERVNLFRPVQEYKVNRGQITIKVGMVKHEFQLPAELITRYNNQLVTVAYEDLTQGIYISDFKTKDELGFVAPKREVHGAIPDQTPEDTRLIHQITGRNKGVLKKARKKSSDVINAALLLNPDAIDLINSHALPKDIRQIAMQDREVSRQLAEQGVKVQMIPQRTVKANAVAVIPAKAKKGVKTTESPFTPANNDMRFIPIDELFKMSEQ